MWIDRRGFLQGAALVAAANLLPLSSGIPSSVSPSLDLAATEDVITARTPNLALRVDGWDCLSNLTGDEVFVSVNQSWRSAWR